MLHPRDSFKDSEVKTAASEWLPQNEDQPHGKVRYLEPMGDTLLTLPGITGPRFYGVFPHALSPLGLWNLCIKSITWPKCQAKIKLSVLEEEPWKGDFLEDKEVT